MKKLLFVSLFLAGVAFSHTASAQVQFSLGIKGGVNFANINVSDARATWDGKTGFHGGAFALIKVTAFAVQPELIFSQQGSTVKINGQDLDANFNYMNVPVMLKFYLPLGLNLQMGPQFGFLTSAESDYNPITNTPIPSVSYRFIIEITDYFQFSFFRLFRWLIQVATLGPPF